MNPLDIIKAALPWIGTALGGPLGGAAASFIGDKLGLPSATVSTITSVLSGMSPDKLAELKEHDQDFQLKMAQMGYDQVYKLEQLNQQFASESANAVNKTMQLEVTSEHWPTYSWRPAIGFSVAFNLMSASLVVFIAYMFKPDLVPQIPGMLTAQAGLNAVAMPILGIASYFRGKAQADPTVQTTPVSSKG
jgi:hypothetical protein